MTCNRPAQPGTTVHVTVADGNVTVVGCETESGARILEATAPTDDVLEAAIQRLDSSGASPNVRAAVDGLFALGYELKPAKTNVPGKLPENYLRIMDPRYTAHGVGYLTPTYFALSRMSDRERLADLPGAELLTAAVKFSHVKSPHPGLNAAKLLKSRWQRPVFASGHHTQRSTEQSSLQVSRTPAVWRAATRE
jgi:hypothetical protein